MQESPVNSAPLSPIPNDNPLGINYKSILDAAQKRTTNLEAIGTLLAVNVKPMLRMVQDVRSTMEMLALRWESLDQEGRDLLPEDVRKFMNYTANHERNLEQIVNYQHIGLSHVQKYAIPDLRAASTVTPIAEPNGSDLHTGEYRIEIAFASNSDEKTIADALQEVYDLNPGAVGGSFEVKCNGVYCWVTFLRELSDDRDYILQRIAKNMLLSPARAAVEQLEAEMLENIGDPDHSDLVGKILEALGTAQVSFPGE